MSSDVSEFLGECEDWDRRHALGIHTLITSYDLELNAARVIATAKRKEENRRKAAEKRMEKRQAKLAEITAVAAAVEEGMDPESEDGEEEAPELQSEEEPESDGSQDVLPNTSGPVTQSQVTRFRVHQDPTPTSSRSSSRASVSQPPTPSTVTSNRRPRPPLSPVLVPKTPPPPLKRLKTQLDDTTTYQLRSRRQR
jgi:ribosomal protein L3